MSKKIDMKNEEVQVHDVGKLTKEVIDLLELQINEAQIVRNILIFINFPNIIMYNKQL